MGDKPTQSTFPGVDEAGMLAAEPVAVLARKLGKVGNRAAVYVLIQWSTRSKEDATWELYTDIEQKFSHFDLTA